MAKQKQKKQPRGKIGGFEPYLKDLRDSKGKGKGKPQQQPQGLAALKEVAALMQLHRALNGGSLEGFRLGDKVWKEGTPGVENPTIQPFMTSENLDEQLAFDQSRDQAFREADAAMAMAQTDRNYNLKQLHEQFLKSSSSTTDEMIGRGLFRSSVKDAALYDLEAQRALQENYLNTAFKNQEIAAQGVKDSYLGQGGYNERFQTSMNQKMAENAINANDAREPYAVPPTAGGFVKAPAKPQAPAAPKSPTSVFQNPRHSGPRQTQLGPGMTIRKVPSRNPKDRLSVGKR